MTTTAPYGSWASPITAATVASGGVRLGQVAWSGEDLFWLEGRPDEGGRTVIVRRSADGAIADAIPAGFNARTTVHEYGGGSFWTSRWGVSRAPARRERSGSGAERNSGSTVFFTNFDDQRLYRVDPSLDAGSQPVPITPEPPMRWGFRYADGVVTPDGRWVVCVRERHMTGREAVNDIVAIPAGDPDVESADVMSEPRMLVTGDSFYAFPRLDAGGTRLAWTSWGHPRMPWDGTELWVAEMTEEGGLGGRRKVAGGVKESIFQPSFGPSGDLYFVSDRSGWWNLYVERDGSVEPVAPVDAELGVPQWVFGLSTYVVLEDETILCLLGGADGTRLSRIVDGGYEDLGLPYRSFPPATLVASGNRVAFIGASPVQAAAVVVVDLATGKDEVVRGSLADDIDPSLVSEPEPITFPSVLDGEPVESHALFYRPFNPAFRAPDGERPPLIVYSHGGPTSATSSALNPEIQFWTSRGIGVVDVNYGGSTGYGRPYRERLKGRWGVVDVDDCVAAAMYLVERGDADEARLAIRGGSAGGYTTLCALTFRQVFAAGASYYGVADAAALARDTHKFESRYLDSLIGPYPAEEDLYRQRSPIHYTDQLSSPMLVLQGLEDMVVPPAQAEEMVKALHLKGIPHAYLPFEGEQHGFRRAENIRRALEAELSFYAQIFGFEPAGDLEKLKIENLG